jgi:hypothetical protein
MNNFQLALKVYLKIFKTPPHPSPLSTGEREGVRGQFALIFEKGLGRGRTGIGGHIPGGK